METFNRLHEEVEECWGVSLPCKFNIILWDSNIELESCLVGSVYVFSVVVLEDASPKMMEHGRYLILALVSNKVIIGLKLHENHCEWLLEVLVLLEPHIPLNLLWLVSKWFIQLEHFKCRWEHVILYWNTNLLCQSHFAVWFFNCLDKIRWHILNFIKCMNIKGFWIPFIKVLWLNKYINSSTLAEHLANFLNQLNVELLSHVVDLDKMRHILLADFWKLVGKFNTLFQWFVNFLIGIF